MSERHPHRTRWPTDDDIIGDLGVGLDTRTFDTKPSVVELLTYKLAW